MGEPVSRRRYLAMTGSAGFGAGMAVLGRPRTAAAAEQLGHGDGIRWPAGQALPTFARPRSLDVLDPTGASSDEQLLLASLQGVVNRTRPRIYLLPISSVAGPTAWLDDLDVPSQPLGGLSDAVARYRASIRGAVVYDPSIPATVNVATTLAGLLDGVVASADLAARAGLPLLVDLRGRFVSDLAAYTWAVDTLWPRASHRMLIGLGPYVSRHLRDYAVANRAMVVDLDPADEAEGALLTQLLADLPVPSPFLGVWPSGPNGEDDFVQLAAQNGVYVIAADACDNLSVFAGVAAHVGAARPAPPAPPLENKVYVTLTMTDGDNLQFGEHRMRQAWDDPNRGAAPLNWTAQPLAADAAPVFLSYYQATASPNDCLVAGPSGAGYTYPGDWPTDAFGAYTELTARYTGLTSMPVQVVINRRDRSDVPFDGATARRYTRDVRPLGLLTNWTDYTATNVVSGDTPMSVSALVYSAAEATGAITSSAGNLARGRGPGPLFVSIGLYAWAMGPADAAAIARSLGDDYRVVRGDHYFTLARQAYGLPARP